MITQDIDTLTNEEILDRRHRGQEKRHRPLWPMDYSRSWMVIFPK